MGNPVVHWEVCGKDSKKLQGFYEKLFDWKIDADNPMGYGMVKTGTDAGINGGIGPTEGGAPAYLTFYVQVEDLQAALDTAKKLGGQTLVPPTEIPNFVTFAMFADPEGNTVGLVKK